MQFDESSSFLDLDTGLVETVWIESACFVFRAEALRQIALGWCQEHHIRWQ